MSIARFLYKDENTTPWFCISNYQPIINYLGDVKIQVDDEDWQGDTRVLYEKDGKLGYLIFGWGSCSGCDALQACGSFEEIDELIERLRNNIKWFDSAYEAYVYFETKDWQLEFSWHADETKSFIEQVKEYLIKRG